MATQTNLFKRLFTVKKSAKKNPDWARVEEPETTLQSATIAVFGVTITAFLVILTYSMMMNSPIEMIAYFLASFDGEFNELYASFAVAIIVLTNLFVTVMFMFFAPVSNDDIVEMISDLDSNTQERLVELEHNVTEHLNHIASDQ
jgi:hypothetical protein